MSYIFHAKLHVMYSICSSASLLAGGNRAVRMLFPYIFSDLKQENAK